MGLCNIYQFTQQTSVKLSDTYSVSIKLTDEDDGKIGYYLNASQWYDKENKILELPTCIGITLPEISLKEEVYKYGNNTKVFLIPDYDKPSDLKIEIADTQVPIDTNGTTTYLSLVEILVNLFLTKLFDQEKFAYKLRDYIPELTITTYLNNFTNICQHYKFTELKLVDYTKYTLDYSAASFTKWTLTFSYNSYEMSSDYRVDIVNNSSSTANPTTDKIAPQDQTVAKDKIPTTDAVAPSTAPVETPKTPSDPKTAALNPSERADELAFAIKQGNYGLGWDDRKKLALKQGFTEEEFEAAKALVNNRSNWAGIDARHFEREKNKTNDITGGNPTVITKPDVNPEDMKIPTKLKGIGDNPERLESNNSSERADELAFAIKQGNYGNKSWDDRKNRALKQGFTEEEFEAAKALVKNRSEWTSIDARHFEREKNKTNDITGGNPTVITKPEVEGKQPLKLKGTLTAPEMPTAKPVDAMQNRENQEADMATASLKASTLWNNPLDEFKFNPNEKFEAPPQNYDEPEPSPVPTPKPGESATKSVPTPTVEPKSLMTDEQKKAQSEAAKTKAGYEAAMGKVQKVRDEEIQDGYIITGRYDDGGLNSDEFMKRYNVIEQRRTDLAVNEGIDYNKAARLKAEDEWSAGKLGSYYK